MYYIIYGRENFDRNILEFCESYDELIEKEKVYVNEEWVNSYNNYNLKTGGQSSGILSQESKNKISETLKRKHELGEITFSDEHREKISLTHKGNKYSLGFKHSNETKLKLSILRKGRVPWNKGLVNLSKGVKYGSMSQEEKEKRSLKLKERYKEQDHHLKGKDPWNKGKKGSQIAWNKGRISEKYKCDHCDVEMDRLNLNKYHMDNCKNKKSLED